MYFRVHQDLHLPSFFVLLSLYVLICTLNFSQLKPRSAGAGAVGSPRSSGKNNPFGAAKPREEVLASKGIDVSTIDSRIDKKAHVAHFTKVSQKKHAFR